MIIFRSASYHLEKVEMRKMKMPVHGTFLIENLIKLCEPLHWLI